MSDLVAYKNVIDGTTYVFAEERPDLDARPNFERIDVGDVTEAQRNAALRAKAQADAIAASARSRGEDTDDSAGAGNSTLATVSAASGVSPVDPGAGQSVGGVLSRGIVRSPFTREELEEKALADSEALATTGALAAHGSGDLTEVALPSQAQATVVSAPPAGSDAGKAAAKDNADTAVGKKTAAMTTPKARARGQQAETAPAAE